ncbi:MAG: sensor histidine kinase [Actinomycetota bacterium]
MTSLTTTKDALDRFHHEALLYEGTDGFLDAIVPFIREGIQADEAVFVVVDAAKIDLLRERLDGDARRARFADMAHVGVNPARIIPAWREFVAEHQDAGRPFRGVGEPIWPGRSPAELVESHLHEALLNVAFDQGPPWWLMCPYDTVALDPAVVDEARRTHPTIVTEGRREPGAFPGSRAVTVLDVDLPEPAGPVQELEIGPGSLFGLRRFVSQRAHDAGLGFDRAAELVLAVNEVATNSLRYGGGAGSLRVWEEPGALLVEISDEGRLREPMAGRQPPRKDESGGRGLWIANQVCDLVQIRSSEGRTVVRLHLHLGDRAA